MATALWCFDESQLPDKTLNYAREVLSRRENFCSSDEHVSYPTHGMKGSARMKSNAAKGLCFGLLVGACALMFGTARGQSTPQPTRVAGANRIARSGDGKSFAFSFNGIALYRYNTIPDGKQTGSFVGLSASLDGNQYFAPAMCGGVLSARGGRVVYPCEKGVSYKLEKQFVTADSVALLWSVSRDNTALYRYWMSFQIRGRTLLIDIQADGNDRNGAGITLGEAYSHPNDLTVVPVPYLSLMNILYQQSSKMFTSMFFDWERTNCSKLFPLAQDPGRALFAQSAEYFPRTDGVRNKIRERIYLTVSGDVSEVLPNVVAPVAPFKTKLQDKIILSYHPPFPTLLEPLIPNTTLPSYLDSLNNLGIRDVALLVKDWWWSGFDKGNPRVLPANDFNRADAKKGRGGGDILLRIRDKAHAYGYWFALHQNYVDMYSKSRPGGSSTTFVDSTLLAKLPGTSGKRAWAFVSDRDAENAWAIKPSRVFNLAKKVSSEIYGAYRADWNYLDVTSSLNPSGPLPTRSYGSVNSYVDFDASRTNSGRDSAGMFLYTLHKYRTVPQAVRSSTDNAPVEGEGGNHFLYAGYFDDFEARIKTAIPKVFGYNAPLFLDFHLTKLRPTSSFHGAGHIYEFYDRGWNTFFTENEVLTFIATEIAYGLGGLVTKGGHNCMDNSPCDHSLKQIALEYTHVLPLQKLLAEAEVQSIAYYEKGEELKTASQYIADHPDGFADIRSPDFMGRIRVEYSNGVVVYVNRNREAAGNWVVEGLPPDRKYNYNIKFGTDTRQGTGAKPSEPIVLPVECGWVWYSPR